MISRFPLVTSISLVLTVCATAQAQNATPRYVVRDLGALGQGTNSSGFDMNGIGWVGGSSNRTPGGPQHAFLWYGSGPLQDLGTLGGPNSAADGPNLLGEAPVISETAKTDPNGEDF